MNTDSAEASEPPRALQRAFTALATAVVLFVLLGVSAVAAGGETRQAGGIDEATAALQSPIIAQLSDQQCLGCHRQEGLDVTLSSGETLELHVDGETYAESVHGQAGLRCSTCHSDITEYPHPELADNSLRELTVRLSQGCDRCHADQEDVWAPGAHGGETVGSNLEVPVCSDCHGAHDVTPAEDAEARVAMCTDCHSVAGFRASAHGQALTAGVEPAATCSGCHGAHTIEAPGAALTQSCTTCHGQTTDLYDQSVHGVAHSAGELEAATCTDCHGPAHDVLPATDPVSPTFPLRLPQTCGACHGDPDLTASMGLPNVLEEYVDSVHGLAISDGGLLVAATCSRCHGSHDIQPHEALTSRVFPSNVIATCGQCHRAIAEEYFESVHGQAVAEGDLQAAVCTDCHGVHTLTESDDPEWKLDVIEECGSCHAESLNTYRDTFHGQVTALGFSRVARCSDCHGSHGIQPIETAASAVSDDNRVETCSQCHEGVTENFAAFSPHADSADRANFPTLYYTRRFMEALIIGVLGFFLIHSSLWMAGPVVRRIRSRRPTQPPAEGA